EWGGAGIEVGSGNGSAQVDVDGSDKNLDLKRCLVDSVYGTDLGFQASPEVRAELSELVNQLEAANPTPNPTEDPTLLDGNWNMPNGSHSLAIIVAEALQFDFDHVWICIKLRNVKILAGIDWVLLIFLLAAEMSEDGSDLLGDCVPVIDVVDILMQEADDSIPKSTISGKPPRHPNSDHTSGSDCSAGKRRKFSTWWSHFDHIPNADHAKCNSATLGAGGGLLHMTTTPYAIYAPPLRNIHTMLELYLYIPTSCSVLVKAIDGLVSTLKQIQAAFKIY
ncbi:hypothetical protein V2J09_010449, partial [Rumex salicifolius]